jgi:hypothetical protein
LSEYKSSLDPLRTNLSRNVKLTLSDANHRSIGKLAEMAKRDLAKSARSFQQVNVQMTH